MGNVLANLARVASATTGTGTLTLGSAVAGALTFAAAGITDGQIVTYAIEDYDGSGNVTNREVGRGTYTHSGTTLSRDTVYSSTNSGLKISCSGNQHVFVTAAKQDFDAIPRVFNVKIYGAVGDGTTEDHTAIQAAIDAASTAGGGTVFFPAATYLIGATLTLKSKVILAGEHYATTVIKAKTALNADLVKTLNYATLTGQNKYLISENVQYGFGLWDLTLDGNASNQSSGNGLVCYGKKYSLKNLVIYNVKQIGWISEAWQTVNTATFPEEPESYYENVDVQNCGSHGIQYRGPTDAVWNNVFTHQNTGWGVRFETDNSTYNAASDVRFMHAYANTAGGVYNTAKMRFGHLCTESNFGEGLVDASFASSYGYLESYINCRTTGTYAISLTGSAIEIARLWNADGAEAVSGLLLTGNLCRIQSGILNGDASTGVGLTLSGSLNHISATVYGYSGTGGKGVVFGSGGTGLSASVVNLELYNNKQGYNVATQGARLAGFIDVNAQTTQTVVGTDFDGTSAVNVRSFDTDTSASVNQILAPAGSASVPGLAFSADRNTGFQNSAADILNIIAGGAEVARFITSSGTGFVAIGAANLYGAPGGQFPLVQINRATAQAGYWAGCWQNNAAAAAQLVLAKSKSGTQGTHGVVANNDVIGEMHFVASDGDEFCPAALIKAEVDGSPGNNDMPTRLVFGVSADGAKVITERLRISQDGTITVTGASVSPSSNDGVPLGTSSLAWSDLFLATGAVINAGNGNAVITHSSGIWTVSTGDLRVTTAGTNAASVVTNDGAQTLQNKTLTSPTINGGTIQSRVQASSEVSGTLTSASANKTVTCTGGVTLPNSVFAAGDMTVFDPGTSSRTFTRGSGIAMYVNGTDVASATLAANKTGAAYWRSASVVILSGGFT